MRVFEGREGVLLSVSNALRQPPDCAKIVSMLVGVLLRIRVSMSERFVADILTLCPSNSELGNIS